MISKWDFNRFLDAQEKAYDIALSEVREGKKKGHWMWFIFPQVMGLGFSTTSNFYAIKNINEAAGYLKHPVLGPRLINISKELLELAPADAGAIFGRPDDLKLKSSMTLFSEVPGANPVFDKVLDKFFQGKRDEITMKLLNA
jgi:uncharacterized protein (DUF1810 family)